MVKKVGKGKKAASKKTQNKESKRKNMGKASKNVTKKQNKKIENSEEEIEQEELSQEMENEESQEIELNNAENENSENEDIEINNQSKDTDDDEEIQMEQNEEGNEIEENDENENAEDDQEEVIEAKEKKQFNKGHQDMNGSMNASKNQSNASQTDENQPNTRIFISNISKSTNNDSLTAFFTENGLSTTDVYVPFSNNANKGFAFAEFQDLESSAKAVELTGNELDGQNIEITYAKPRRDKNEGNSRNFDRKKSFGNRGDPTNIIFIKNLSHSTNEESLRSKFKDAKEIRIMTNQDGSCRGHAYIEYDDTNSAKNAKEKMAGQRINGSEVILDYAQPRGQDGGNRGGRFNDRRGGRGGGDRRGGHGGRGGFGGGNRFNRDDNRSGYGGGFRGGRDGGRGGGRGGYGGVGKSRGSFGGHGGPRGQKIQFHDDDD